MRKFWKHVKRWLVPAHDLRALTPRQRRGAALGFDQLESRETPAGNLAFSNVTFLDGAGNPIINPVVGERITLKVDWNAAGLVAGDQYVVRATVGTITLDSAVFTHASTGNLTTTLSGWYAASGNTYQVFLDPLAGTLETDENDNNIAPVTFNGALPTTLPMRLAFPVANSAGNFTEWTIGSYVDVDPRVGTVRDYLGSNPPLAIDQSDGLDITLPTYGAMDLGRNHVVAAASGSVEAVVYGSGDRNTAGSSVQGNYIRINHGNGWKTEYFNLAQGSTTLRPGESVAQGQTIALVGSSGTSTGPHLHFVLTRNGAPVEPFLLPNSYFAGALGHQLLQTRRVLNSGTTNYDPATEMQEKPVDTTSFPTAATFDWNVYYYAHVNFLLLGETAEVRWFAPGNPTPVSTNTFTETSPVAINKPIIAALPPTIYKASPGTWTVEISVNGLPLSSSAFLVPGSGAPTTHVTANGKYLPASRTTPIEFGSTTVNGPGNSQTFVITNTGSVALNVFNVTVPTGFAFLGTAPPASTTLLPAQTLSFIVRIDPISAGEKVGALRFQTSAAIGNFSYNLHATVAGTPPVGAPAIFFPGSAAPSFGSTAPFVLEPNANFADSDSANLNGGRLTVEFLNTTLAENNLAIRNQGTGSGQIGTSGNNVTFGSQVIGTFAVVSGTSLTVNFNSSSATPAAVEALLRNITFADTNATPATGIRYVKFAVLDNASNVSNIVVKAVYPAPTLSFSSRFLVTEPGGSTPVVEAGPSDSYTIQLTSAPAAGTTVTINILPVSQVTTDRTSLTFTNGDFNVPQSITVTAIDDTVPEGSHRGTIVHSVTSNDPLFDGALIPVVSPTVTDNDVGLVLGETFGSTTVSEDGATDTVTFSLATPPTASVTVTLTPNTHVNASPTTLLFTPANWNVPQTVIVGANEDGIIGGLHPGSIAVASSSSDLAYNNLTVAPVAVNIVDNDFAGVRLNLPGTGLLTAEGGGTATFTARLTSLPSANVVIAVNPDAQVGANPVSITFTPANWNIEQSVIIAAVDDFVAEGNHTGSFGFTVTSADTSYNAFVVSSQSVSILDNDVASVIVTQSGGSTDITEGSTTDAISIVLTGQPLPGKTITILLNGGSQVTLAPPQVTFTNADWNVPKVITVSASQDTVIEGFHTQNITFLVNSNDPLYDQFSINPISVNITDDDSPAVIVIASGSSTDVSESGAFDFFTIHLSVSQPGADVKITLLPNGQVTAVKDQTSGAFVIFTPANWNVDQVVRVNAVDDFSAEGNHLGSIAFAVESSDTRYHGLIVAPHVASVTDNDTAGITLVETSGSSSVTEGGSSDVVTLVLTSQPTANVVIDLAASSHVTATPASVFFTPQNWNVVQTVTLGAVDDSLIEGNHTGVVSFAVTSADSRYNGFSRANLNIAVIDNDALGVVINQSGTDTSVTEGGVPDSYVVVLTMAPSADVIINFSADNQIGMMPSQLIFTPSNFNVPQSVTVLATEDNRAEGNHTSLITHAASSTDSRYNGVSIASVPVVITDNDVAGVQVLHSHGSTLVVEGGAGDTLVITLTSQPTANVVLSFATDAQITTNPSSLSFSTTNWNMPQVITVSAVNDALTEGSHTGKLTFVVDSTDAVYAALNTPASPFFDVPIQDNDTAGVNVTHSGGNTVVSEGVGFDTYAVVLGSQPSADVTLNIAPAAAGQLTVSPASITFTAGNWNVPQNVQVVAVNDNSAEGTTSVTLNHSIVSTDARYADLTLAGVSTTIIDDDFTGESLPDIIGRAPNGNWYVARSTGTSFVTSIVGNWGQVNWADVRVGDFNGDGREDVAGRIPQTGDWFVMASQGTTSYVTQKWANWGAKTTWVDVLKGDFNDDGKDDIVGRIKSTGQWWANLSSGTSFTVVPFGTWGAGANVTWADVQTGDFDGDGKTDVFGRHVQTGNLWVGRSTGTGFTNQLFGNWNRFVTWVDVRTGDVSGDGKTDVVGRVLQSGNWFAGISTGTVFAQAFFGNWDANAPWLDVELSDFNGDGKADLLGRRGNALFVGVSTGTAFNTSRWFPSVSPFLQLVKQDFDGDGKADIAGKLTNGQWLVYISTGTAFKPPVLWTVWPAVAFKDIRTGYIF